MSNPKVFISYSWDNAAHEQWVIDFANKLRKNGIDAEIDKFITQEGTVNLNRMMVDKIRESDFTLVVMTENYAIKANDFQGGVGFETQLMLSTIRECPEKIIPVLKGRNLHGRAIPFYLKGFEYTDISNQSDFEEKFNVLLHKIFGVPLYEKAPLGERPALGPKYLSRVFMFA